jgi:hypothetical protein
MLTGQALIKHEAQTQISRSDRVRSAGYHPKSGRTVLRYCEYFSNLQRAKIQDSAINSYGRKVDMETVEAIKNHKNKNIGKNTSVYHYAGISTVYLYDKKIANVMFNINKVAIFSSGYMTKTTKSRLNRILMHFCGARLFQKAGIWYIDYGCKDMIPFVEGMEIDMI